MAIHDEDIKDFLHLCRKLEEFKTDGHWIFRGVSDQTHQLIPKVGRPQNRRTFTGEPAPFSKAEEARLYKQFERAARPYVQHEPKGKLEWLAIGQHHGLFTRLLDWTESLFTAAYFAVHDPASKLVRTVTADGKKLSEWEARYPVIYATKEIPVADENKGLEELELDMLYYPPHLSPRVPAQQSVFTVHRNPQEVFKPKHLVKLSLKHYPLAIKRSLNACGVNRASLFPDIDGLADHRSWLYKWGMLREEAISERPKGRRRKRTKR